MKHYGDITKLNGADLPKVDVITGGSPCQDLSVAGNRKGLAGERSGLFIEQIRVIKEMRNSDSGRTNEHIRPRYMVWENVPGALSSNKGNDFRCVLEETARIADKSTTIPRPTGGGQWSNSGCILGDGWSIAWRVHDAQFWGVPQRRKRIALVADFGGQSAPEILFERKSMSGDIDQSGETRQGTSTNTERSTAPSSYTLKIRGGVDRDCYGKKAGKGALIQTELSATLGVSQDQTLITGINGDIAGTLDASYYKECGERQGIERDVVFDARGNGDGEIAPTITGDHQNRVTDYTALCIGNGQLAQLKESDKVGALNCMHDQQAIVTYGLDRASYNQGKNAKFDFSVEEELIGAQTARGPGAICHSVVRRLTPLECERLQGYPDNWTNIGEWIDSKGKKRKDADSPRYKALGNSLALPFWRWMAARIVKNLGSMPTMGSLFDGIGGFPLVFQENGCTPVWASEIEEFPIAVTKIRFPEVDDE